MSTPTTLRPAGPLPGLSARKACAGLAKLVEIAILVLAAVMLLALAWQVLMRYAFDKAPSWSEELAITCFSWSMLLAIALGVRDAIHVRMDLFIDRLPPALRGALEKLTCVTIAAVGALIAWAGLRYTLDTAGAASAAMGYPIGWLNASAPASGALMVVFGLERLVSPPPAAAEEA